MYEPLPIQPSDPVPPLPVSIKVLAILAIIVGALGTIGCGIGALSDSLAVRQTGGIKAGDTLIPLDGRLLTFVSTFAVLDLGTSALLVVTAYATLRRWSWGRKAAVVVSAAIVLIAVLKFIGMVGIFRQQVLDVRLATLAVTPPENREVTPSEQQIRLMSYVAPIFSFLVQAIVPSLILLFWTRRGVIANSGSRPATNV